MRIVFMGTPEFAVPSLEALLEAGYEVVAACTQPDRPAGRGNRLTACPVKMAAEKRGIPVLQFERLRRKAGVEALTNLKPDLFVTAAFGQILSQKLLDIPPLGTVNVHASLLPKYRGAAPINWCILAGEKVAGVTTMLTDAGIDTGDMLMQSSLEIGMDETAGELTERLSHLGAELLIETLKAIEAGNCPRRKQDPELASHQPMLDKAMGLLDFTLDAATLNNRVRGLNPWPGAYAPLEGGTLKIWSARPLPWTEGGQPGEIVVADAKRGLIVRCGGESALEILEMQAPNAKRMRAKAYLMGKPLPLGAVLRG